jgi:O-methyltransferase/methyltransferase family protein
MVPRARRTVMAEQNPFPIPPPFQVSRLATSYWVPQAIHAAAVLGVADALAGGPRSSADVARAIDANPAALHRLMRALVALELCTLGPDGAFALTPLGECLRSDSRDSVRAWVLLIGDERHRASWARLAEVVRTGRSVPELDGRDTWVEASDDPAASDVFNQSMVQLTRHLAAGVAVSYDFSRFRTIVDVGGGYGALLPPILKANPGLHGMVFDLPRCRDGFRALATKLGLADRYEFVGGDFFADPLPAADAYIIKSVIHDWDDERSVAILRNIRAAMAPESRLLVVEPIVPDRPGSTPFDAMMAHTDLNMLVVTGGRERTEADFRGLIEKAGLEVTRIVPTPATMSIIEARRT